MKIIVGLGNPGKRYKGTRHNIGFMVLDEISSIWGIKLKKKGVYFTTGTGEIEGHKVVLAKPQTYMNRSGTAVAGILKEGHADPSDLLVIHDDIDMELGKMRVKKKGGHGGHNGVRSIIDSIGSEDFMRVKIGIGRPPRGEEPSEYVLEAFTEKEIPVITEAIGKAVETVEAIVRGKKLGGESGHTD